MRKYFSSKIGNVLLGVWLILIGIAPLLTIPVPPLLTSLLAVVAGVLLLAGR